MMQGSHLKHLLENSTRNMSEISVHLCLFLVFIYFSQKCSIKYIIQTLIVLGVEILLLLKEFGQILPFKFFLVVLHISWQRYGSKAWHTQTGIEREHHNILAIDHFLESNRIYTFSFVTFKMEYHYNMRIANHADRTN